MSGLLPSTPELSLDPDPGPRVIGLESDDASETLAALSSETARELLSTLHEDPATPSALADRVGTSLQNAQYHLQKLESAELIKEVGTQYSEKGREMTVYAAANGPLVVYPGDDGDEGYRRLIRRLIGGVALVGLVAILIEAVARAWLPGLASSDESLVGRDGAAPFDAAAESATLEDPHWLVELVTSVSPGLAFFLGGTLVLLLILAVWYRRGVLIR